MLDNNDRIDMPIDAIEIDQLRRDIADTAEFSVGSITHFPEIESTNSYLARSRQSTFDTLDVCCADFQSAGRGRNARPWQSIARSGICLSCAWTYRQAPENLSAMALAAGVVAVDALVQLDCDGIELKWPNDLVWESRKLGGILVETKISAGGICHIVLGIGINHTVPVEQLRELSDWHSGAVDLSILAGGRPPSRHAVIVSLARGFGAMFEKFGREGFAAFVESWRAVDHLKDKLVSISDEQQTIPGTARGIAADGALLVERPNRQIKRIVSADVSVRLQ